MAQLCAVVNCYRSPRTFTIQMMSSSQLDSKNGIENRVELSSNEAVSQRSSLGLYAMNGGEGPHSYAQNSLYQRGVVDVAKALLEGEIATKLDIDQLSSERPNPFCIADFGCSTGHNSFPAMKIITEAVEKKLQLNSHIPDFQVFFNDQVKNDFNTLFNSLPTQRRYHAAGVPGPFHGRLLPKKSIHFAYSSCSLNWLSKVPGEIEDENSPAWNKGKVHYTGAREEVFNAYSKTYANGIESFLGARADELVSGGLMALLVPAALSFDYSDTTYTTASELDLLGSCLMDMAKKGRVSEAKVDSFNFPLYFTIPDELREIIDRNQKFSIERMEILNNPGKRTLSSANARSTYLRATQEGLLINHFGGEIVDELFDRYTKKIAASPLFLDPENEKSIIIFVVLKRNVE